jgi:hypothetical protein
MVSGMHASGRHANDLCLPRRHAAATCRRVRPAANGGSTVPCLYTDRRRARLYPPMCVYSWMAPFSLPVVRVQVVVTVVAPPRGRRGGLCDLPPPRCALRVLVPHHAMPPRPASCPPEPTGNNLSRGRHAPPRAKKAPAARSIGFAECYGRVELSAGGCGAGADGVLLRDTVARRCGPAPCLCTS